MRLYAWALALLVVLAPLPVRAQIDSTGQKPFSINVNKIHLDLSPAVGDGGMSTQWTWNTVLRKEQTEPFYYPADQWYSNMLTQLWNIPNFSDSGYVDRSGARRQRVWRIHGGSTDWSWERRRYRPPHIIVDGIRLDPPYQWEVDPNLPVDYMGVFEDVYRDRSLDYGGLRSRTEIYAFSNPNHQDYFIWKETRKFTGEMNLGRELSAPTAADFLPDQTVRLWWAFTFAFAPTKGGERQSWGFFAFEGEDDKEHFFVRPSELVPNRARTDLTVAHYWDDMTTQSPPYTITSPDGSTRQTSDDAGDPNRLNGGLVATQVPGFTILHADRSAGDHTDDPAQPIAAPRGNVNNNLFGQQGRIQQRDVYAGFIDPWPDPTPAPQKGSMRALTTGPYDLGFERDAAGRLIRADSFTVVYAIGVGDVGHEFADSLGRAWFRGEISDEEKRVFIPMGRDSLFKALDRANWAWNNGLKVPAPPPPPDIEVTSGPDYNQIDWSYPEERYWLDPHGGVNDFYVWRIYRKTGGYWVHDPADQFQGQKWELIYETTNPSEQTYRDTGVERGVAYYYTVTAVDDGSQNTFGLFPGQRLESSRYANRSQLPAIAFKPGLDVSNLVRVVPNPATSAAGDLGFPGEPNKILFVNLPVEATLSIFTENGELVRRIRHFGTADESWDQRTDGNQYVTSGIYILAVHEARDLEGNRLPDQFVKFVIIR